MKKKRRRKVLYVLVVLLMTAGIITVWFRIPYSPLKSEFGRDIGDITGENRLPDAGGVFTEEDFAGLPQALRKYAERCGYIGKPKMSFTKMEYRDVDFAQGREGPELKIDYTQYDFVQQPCRMAFIDSGMFGVPFQGYDYYRGGKGGMKGVLGKAVTLFHQTGEDMDEACLVTYLAECIFAPSAFMQDYVTFEEISGHEVKAVISCGGQTVSGIFTFNDDYEMTSFTTNDRKAASADGTVESIPWSAECSGYEINEDGILCPTRFRAVWHYPDGDFVYFDGAISGISYGY